MIKKTINFVTMHNNKLSQNDQEEDQNQHQSQDQGDKDLNPQNSTGWDYKP